MHPRARSRSVINKGSCVAALAVYVLLCLISRRAQAHYWVNKDVIYASRVSTSRLYLTAGTTYTFRAYTDGDVVIHLYRDGVGQVGWSDDYIPGNVHLSRFSYTASVSAYYTLVGRGYSSASTARLEYCVGSPSSTCAEASPIGLMPQTSSNWSLLGGSAPMGGTKVQVAVGTATTFRYQTAQATTNATDDTVLVALDSNGWLVGYDDDSAGRGWMAMLDPYITGPQLHNVDEVLVGAYSAAGYTSLYTNDVTQRDDDGDGLGHQLEYYLGTCDSSSASATPTNAYCVDRALALLKDSDRDGLSDVIEVFGTPGPTPWESLPLAAWGASPTRKDIFIEQDWVLKATCTSGGTDDDEGCWSVLPTMNPFTEAMAQYVQDRLNEGSKDEYLNINGNGVALHMDIGVPCPTHPTLCGAWGGGGEQIMATDVVPDWGNPDYTNPTHFDSTHRKGVFRYLAVYPEGGHTAQPGWVIRAGIGGGGPVAAWNGRTVTHELGHSLGLTHGGAPGMADENCKPNYNSVMSYAVVNSDGTGFSHGLNTVALDPANVAENFGIAGSASYLAEGDRSRTAFEFPIADGYGNVDWNRTRSLDSPARVRAGVRHAVLGQCGAGVALRTKVEGPYTPGTMSHVSPELAEFGGRLYVFWADGRYVRYRSDTHSGPNDRGSCSGGTGTLGESNCNTWSPPQIVVDTGGDPVAGISALEFDNELVIAYTTNPSSGSRSALKAMRAVSAAPDGTLAPLTAPQTLSTNVVRDSEVELSAMYGVLGSSSATMLAAFVADASAPDATTGDLVWYQTDHPSNGWQIMPFPVYDSWGAPVHGRRAPAVTTWPHKSVGIPDPGGWGGYACGVFGRPNGMTSRLVKKDTAEFGCYDRTTGMWHLAPMVDRFGAAVQAVGRHPSIALHTPREAGSLQQPGLEPLPINGDRSRGQFWITLQTADNEDAFIWTVSGFGYWSPPSPLSGGGPRQLDFFYDPWSRPLGYAGIPLFESANLSALKGAFLSPRDKSDRILVSPRPVPDTHNEYEVLGFMPFVDGTAHASLRDTNDFRVMERGICLGLHELNFDDTTGVCGPKNPSNY